MHFLPLLQQAATFSLAEAMLTTTFCSQYTSMSFCDSALDAHVALSFGSVGDAFDNAAMEAFWSTLKRELAHIHGRQHWTSRAELRAALFDSIEAFYNRARHQAGLGHLIPAEFEDTLDAA